MANLTDIEGIGPTFAEKLKGCGVTNVAQLLEKGGTKKGRTEIAEATGIDAKRILRFVNHADLMRLNGVGGQYSELLEAAGVDSVAELARRNAANLHQKMVETNEAKKLVRSVAALSQVEKWIAQAGELPKAVHH